jgi:glycosyltransferase involved in cell wall biosynthesis
MMPPKPALLYISPIIPAMTGNGLAMRAGTVLEILAARYDVHLFVVPLYGSVTKEIPGPLEKLCRRASIASRQGLRPWDATRFDVVHVFRLAMLRFSEPYLRGFFRRPRRYLDLDDIESITLRRVAKLHRENNDAVMAEQEEWRAARQEIAENEAFRRFDRVYVCSALDREKLLPRSRAEVRVLPNAVRIPVAVPAKPPGPVFQFLFVGNLGYYPNDDSVRHLCAEILPRIRELAGPEFVLNIVGTAASESLRRAVDVPQVRFVGWVADLDPWYAEADAVVAPLRAGGGTRIKILEAFSYQRPVVATSIAMEGIEAVADEHVLIGDTPAAFAAKCAQLMLSAELRDRLARNAFALLLDSYTIESLQKAQAAFDPVAARRTWF